MDMGIYFDGATQEDPQTRGAVEILYLSDFH